MLEGTNYYATKSGQKESIVTSPEVIKIKTLTQAEYDALATKDEQTLYLIIGNASNT